MASVQNKRKASDVQDTFDDLRKAALHEHKLRTERSDVLLQTIKEATTEFKSLLIPGPAYQAYKAFADENADRLSSKKTKRSSRCNHPGCDRSFVMGDFTTGEICGAGHAHHICKDGLVLGATEECRQCQNKQDRRSIGLAVCQIRAWNSVKDLQRMFEP